MGISMGIDPGFANVGVSIVDASNRGFEVKDIRVFCTSKSTRIKYVADDNIRRIKELQVALEDYITHWNPRSFCVERMTYPRNASTAAKTAMFWGMLVALSIKYGVPIISVSSQDVKKCICGNRKATKQDVIDKIKADIDLPVYKLPKAKEEHCFDALANVLSIIQDEKLPVSIC